MVVEIVRERDEGRDDDTEWDRERDKERDRERDQGIYHKAMLTWGFSKMARFNRSCS